jgi:histone-lysine N-methyltransferase SETMAR
MLTIGWNPRGFHLINVLEKGRKFNTNYYIAEILDPLSYCPIVPMALNEAAGNKRRLLVHADNARPHTAKLSTQYFNENRMKSVPHPPYSADLAPSDFSLFGYVKRCPQVACSRMRISFLQQ